MIKAGSKIECEYVGPHGKPVVAVIGFIHDWAAYERAYDDQTTIDSIARNGDKIGEDEARELFPELKSYKYRG